MAKLAGLASAAKLSRTFTLMTDRWLYRQTAMWTALRVTYNSPEHHSFPVPLPSWP